MNSIPFCLSRRYLARRRKPGEFFGYIWATRCCAARRRGVTWHLRTDGAACRSSYELNDFHPGCRVTRVLGVSVRVNVGQFPFHSLVLWRWRAVFLKEGSISLYCDIYFVCLISVRLIYSFMWCQATIYDGEIKLYTMCREYTENELQREWIVVIILILFS